MNGLLLGTAMLVSSVLGPPAPGRTHAPTVPHVVSFELVDLSAVPLRSEPRRPLFQSGQNRKKTQGEKTDRMIIGILAGYFAGGLLGGYLGANAPGTGDSAGLSGALIGAPIGALVGGMIGWQSAK